MKEHVENFERSIMDYNKSSRVGLVPGRASRKVSDEEILAMYDPKMSIKKNAEIMGFSHEALKHRLFKLSLREPGNIKVVPLSSLIRRLIRDSVAKDRWKAPKDEAEMCAIIEYLSSQKLECALTGAILILPASYMERSSGTISIDRIDSSKPYAADNVRFVHKVINVMRMNLSDEQLYYASKAIVVKRECDEFLKRFS